ncbi:MAG: UDP-N-acetylmuramate--L-alanine ligase, partial [Actinobacteria bacterium]|nr:UDP-N-acetylmuramate--L-alanine ligase [Actinomycetota bacterium]
PNILSLEALGAKIAIGHDEANLGDADTVVVTSALWPTNPEYLLAKKRNLPIIHRSQALAHLASEKRLVSVAGAHGKTTSTGMIITALLGMNQDPSFVNGGVISAIGSSSQSGKGDLFVIEADESDGSFLLYDTAIALITNVDPDHLDHYGSIEAFHQVFADFANKSKELVVINSDDFGAKAVAKLITKPMLTFGEATSADVRVSEISEDAQVSFSLSYRQESYSATLSIAGRHNAINAAGAVATLIGLGFGLEESIKEVANFGGTERRFELHGERRGVKVYDDFAHHPTEVSAALNGARAVVGDGKIVTVFQPHLYSRTRLFAKEFAKALEASDEVVLLDIYAAREDPEPGVTGELILNASSNQDKIHYVNNWSDAPAVAARLAGAGDFIVTMGCGDVYKMVPEILEALES